MSPEWLHLMARYNAWQNGWMIPAVAGLSDAERDADRGSFFDSIAGTLSHLMWADTIWVSRFDGGPSVEPSIPASATMFRDWPAFVDLRSALDQRILDWAATETDTSGQISWYSGAMGRQMTADKMVCMTQLFNHQTHHRGQVHAMLTAAGVKTQDTDVPFMPGL